MLRTPTDSIKDYGGVVRNEREEGRDKGRLNNKLHLLHMGNLDVEHGVLQYAHYQRQQVPDHSEESRQV